MACTYENTVNITACFVPSSVTWCDVGTSCSVSGDEFNSDCAFTGVAEQFLSKLTALSFKCFDMVKTCIQDEDAAPDLGCDIIFGKNYNLGNVSDYWGFSAIYNTDAVSALYKSQVTYNPWDFLKPFSPSLWILIFTVLCLLTPLVMAIVEYDEGETVFGNFIKFLPDSIHAHAGIDLLNNDLPTKNTSYVLSVFVSLFAFITISLYATNLTAFVLYKNNSNPQLDIRNGLKIFVEESVHAILPIDTSVPVNFLDIPALHVTGYFDYIVAENYLLRNIKTCDDLMVPLRGVGVSKYIFIARKFGKENIKIIDEKILAIDFAFDISRELCDNIATPINLNGIYGLFLVVAVPAFIIACMVMIRHFFIKRAGNPYITNSP
jgi:hypothetical protein